MRIDNTGVAIEGHYEQVPVAAAEGLSLPRRFPWWEWDHSSLPTSKVPFTSRFWLRQWWTNRFPV